MRQASRLYTHFTAENNLAADRRPPKSFRQFFIYLQLQPPISAEREANVEIFFLEPLIFFQYSRFHFRLVFNSISQIRLFNVGKYSADWAEIRPQKTVIHHRMCQAGAVLFQRRKFFQVVATFFAEVLGFFESNTSYIRFVLFGLGPTYSRSKNGIRLYFYEIKRHQNWLGPLKRDKRSILCEMLRSRFYSFLTCSIASIGIRSFWGDRFGLGLSHILGCPTHQVLL